MFDPLLVVMAVWPPENPPCDGSYDVMMSREATRLGSIEALTTAPLSTIEFCSGGSPWTEYPTG